MDEAERNEVAQKLLRNRDGADVAGDALADLIDMLTMPPDERRRVVRLIAEVEATGA